jgi:UDP:flavonoid glycosyltransferase YjiC (YdhE family)
MSGLGFLYPSIRLAHILQKNSHHVLFVSTDEHSITLANYGMDHIPVKSNIRRFLDLHRWGYPDNVINDYSILSKIIDQYHPDAIVTSPLAIISFILGQKYQIPIINIGFCEYLFPAKLQDNYNKQWRIEKFTEVCNSFRAQLRLPLIEKSNIDSPLIGTKYLLRSVPALNDDITLPDQVTCIGDLYFEPVYINRPLSNFLAHSKATKKRVVYMQLGRLFHDVNVWRKLLSTLANFIVDTGRADYSISDAKKYNNFFTSHFIPIGAVKNDIDFVICTGQTTSVISSIIHDKQILAIPHSGDSVELSNRLVSKNLACAIYDLNDITIDRLNELFQKLSSNLFKPTIVDYKKQFLAYNDDVVYEIIKSI